MAVLIRAGLSALSRGHFELPAQHSALVARMQYGDDVFVRFVLENFEKAAVTERPLSSKVIQARFVRYIDLEEHEIGHVTPVSIMKRIVPLMRSFFNVEMCDIGGVKHYRNVRWKDGPSL